MENIIEQLILAAARSFLRQSIAPTTTLGSRIENADRLEAAMRFVYGV